MVNEPDEERGGDQQYGQVDCHCCLKVERFEKGCCVGHQQ